VGAVRAIFALPTYYLLGRMCNPRNGSFLPRPNPAAPTTACTKTRWLGNSLGVVIEPAEYGIRLNFAFVLFTIQTYSFFYPP
jgi:hypothetical protein